MTTGIKSEMRTGRPPLHAWPFLAAAIEAASPAFRFIRLCTLLTTPGQTVRQGKA